MPSPSLAQDSGGRCRIVAAKLRDQILNGHYPSGSQLPTFDNLVGKFGISRATMQLSIRQLKEEGFVRSVHRSGLFVAEHPPHLHRFGLVFASEPGERHWNRFMAALNAEAPVVVRAREGSQIVPFHSIQADKQCASYDRLLTDVMVHRLAGLIITERTAFMLQRPEIVKSGIPRIAINHLVQQSFGAPVVNTDEPLFYRKALAWLAERGRKRVAVLAMRQIVGVTLQDCAQAGLTSRPHWLCPIGSDFSGQTKSVVQLLLDYSPEERPDAIILATDHLVEEALAAIHGSGVVIGRDIDIVAHCNWPWAVESPLPIARLGFHSHDFLKTALDLIGMIRRGENPPQVTLIPARFEHELEENE